MGITSMEYAVFILALVASLIVMQVPLRRALSSKWRDTGDAFGAGRQYDSTKSVVTVR
jgi:Flp pilus assembly pilin Flp